jgi:hypothetical protein
MAWQLMKGPIPQGKWVLHNCDNRLCVNPDHLFLGTHTDNMRDMHRKARGRSTIGPEEAAQIKQRRKNGELCRVIAEDLGISIFIVKHISRGLTWVDVN